MSGFKPPKEFNFAEPHKWPEWKDRFQRFRICSKLDKESGELQVNSLIYSMGIDAEKIYKTFTYQNDGDNLRFDPVLQKFDGHFVPQKNVIHLRASFHKRKQKEGETIEQYVRQLYELAEQADFDNKDDMIRDRLVEGVLDQELSEKLQLTPDLTLQQAIVKSRQHEQVKNELSEQREIPNTDTLKRHQKHGPGRQNQGRQNDFEKQNPPNRNNFGRRQGYRNSDINTPVAGVELHMPGVDVLQEGKYVISVKRVITSLRCVFRGKRNAINCTKMYQSIQIATATTNTKEKQVRHPKLFMLIVLTAMINRGELI